MTTIHQEIVRHSLDFLTKTAGISRTSSLSLICKPIDFLRKGIAVYLTASFDNDKISVLIAYLGDFPSPEIYNKLHDVIKTLATIKPIKMYVCDKGMYADTLPILVVKFENDELNKLIEDFRSSCNIKVHDLVIDSHSYYLFMCADFRSDFYINSIEIKQFDSTESFFIHKFS